MRETVTEMATGCLRMVKMDIFVLITKDLPLVSNQKMELCLFNILFVSVILRNQLVNKMIKAECYIFSFVHKTKSMKPTFT